MDESNKIVKKDLGIDKSKQDEILANQYLLRELREKIKDKIINNDPMLIKTLKYMISDTGKKEIKE